MILGSLRVGGNKGSLSKAEVEPLCSRVEIKYHYLLNISIVTFFGHDCYFIQNVTTYKFFSSRLQI